VDHCRNHVVVGLVRISVVENRITTSIGTDQNVCFLSALDAGGVNVTGPVTISLFNLFATISLF
jgi:hypothetical protein